MIHVCKGTCAPLPPYQRAGGQCLRNSPPFRRPCTLVKWQDQEQQEIKIIEMATLKLLK